MAILQSTSITGSLSVSGSTFTVPYVSNPDTGSEGLMWVDPTNNSIKFTSALSFGQSTWTTSDFSLLRCRYDYKGSGTANSGIVWGGRSDGCACYSCVEHYDGTSWSSGNNSPICFFCHAGDGTATDTLSIGGCTVGQVMACFFTYDCSTWTKQPDIIQVRADGGLSGTSNSATFFGGLPSCCLTEEFNGTTWASGPAMANCFYRFAGAGRATDGSAIAAGGEATCFSTCTYDAIAWTQENCLNINRAYPGGGGDSTTFLITGGTCCCNKAESWNGSTWAMEAQMPQTQVRGATGGSVASAWSGRGTCGCTSTTMEFEAQYVNRYKFWSQAANISNPLFVGATSGPNSDSVLSVTGRDASNTPQRCSEEYDGTTWTAQSQIIYDKCETASTGTTSAFLIAGGYFNGGTCCCSESWNGSTWATETALPTNKRNHVMLGTQNAAFLSGGTCWKCVTLYDGTTWSAGTDSTFCFCRHAGGGTQNTAILFGGCAPGATTCCCTNEWDGTSWATGGALNFCRKDHGGAATNQDEAVAFGGCSIHMQSCSEEYDGASWSTGINTLSTRFKFEGAGNGVSAMAARGCNRGCVCFLTQTEKYGTLSDVDLFRVNTIENKL
jgi:hypothetical protein